MKSHYKFLTLSILLISCFAFIPETKKPSAGKSNYAQEKNFVVDSVTAIFTKISAGGTFTLALKSDNTVWAWGSNLYGQLGRGDIKESTFPVIVNITHVVAISAGFYHALALKKDGTVWTWGDRLQIYNATKEFTYFPENIPNFKATGISAERRCYIALSKGSAWTWGPETRGKLGSIGALDNITSISGGSGHSVALKKDGTIWAWGNNGYGQLGDGTKIAKYSATQTATSSKEKPKKKKKPAKAW